MREYFGLWVLAQLLLEAPALLAQDPYVFRDAPQDRPVSARTEDQHRRMEAALAPYIAQGRATYPQAKARYLAGLPPQQSFFVVARLQDSLGHFEITFVAVDSLVRDSVFGRIWNEINVVRRYHLRDPYALPEAELLDWLITKPDGSEEGNVVGKFLETYRP